MSSEFSDFWENVAGKESPEIEFRTSKYMNGIPIHSKPGDRNYQNFIIQAYDWDDRILDDLQFALENKLIDLVGEYLGYSESEWWFGYVIATEAPTEISPYNAVIDGRWFFRVEKDGRIVYEKSGYTSNL